MGIFLFLFFLVWCARHQSLINLIKYATIRDQTWQSKTVNLFLFYRFRFPHFQVSFLFFFILLLRFMVHSFVFFYSKHSQKKKRKTIRLNLWKWMAGWFFFFLLLRWRWISMQMIPDRDNRQQNIYDIKKKEIYNIYLYTLEKNKWSTTRAIEAPAVEERHTQTSRSTKLWTWLGEFITFFFFLL